MSFRYTEAIVCRLPDDLSSKVDLRKCRTEFEELIALLRDAGVDVIELPPPEQTQQSPFVGDVCFIVNGMAIISRPKPFEQEITAMMRTVLRKELDIPVVEVKEEGVNIQGGDVIFTGRELFVGISKFTNEAGALFLANTFPELSCSPIQIPTGDKHLTDFVNMAAPGIICVGSCKDSQDVIKRIERRASYRYETITMPNDYRPEVLCVNGHLLHLVSEGDIFSDKLLNLSKRGLEMEEFSKLSANFSRLVVLLNKSRIKCYT